MSLYSSSSTQPHRQSARYYEYPARHGSDLSHGPRVDVYDDNNPPAPISLPRRYPDSDREHRTPTAPVFRGPPSRITARDASPGSVSDYEQRTPRRKSIAVRPRSTSRVRLQEPAAVILYTSSSSSSEDDEEPRRRSRKDRDGEGHTRIRATSRPGKKNEYALVRTPSKKEKEKGKRAKSKGKSRATAGLAVVTDLELKTGRKYRDFRGRRDDLEDREARVLVRARSRTREGLGEEDFEDEDVYGGGRRRSIYDGESRRKQGSIDDGRRAIVVAGDRDSRRRKSSHQEPKLYSYGRGIIAAGDEESLRSGRSTPRRRQVSLSPDRETISSSTLGDSVRRATTVSSRGQNPSLSRVYHDSPAPRRDPRRDSAYFTDNDRRAKDREREAIDREKRAIEREKAALDREMALVDREKRAPAALTPDAKQMGPANYLKQGQGYLKDGQKYYKSGQGLLNGAKNFNMKNLLG